jgi:hypothetical protein
MQGWRCLASVVSGSYFYAAAQNPVSNDIKKIADSP